MSHFGPADVQARTHDVKKKHAGCIGSLLCEFADNLLSASSVAPATGAVRLENVNGKESQSWSLTRSSATVPRTPTARW
jgi:hypothetical protein